MKKKGGLFGIKTVVVDSSNRFSVLDCVVPTGWTNKKKVANSYSNSFLLLFRNCFFNHIYKHEWVIK